jgi:micrococcal nuclease
MRRFYSLFGVSVRMRFLFLLLAAGLMTHHALSQELFRGVVSHVSDGDTLWVRSDAGGRPHKLRIDGIDAPELCQNAGEASRLALMQHALRQRVVVKIRQHDSYGRGLARIERDGVDLGAQMVREGQAWSHRWHRSAGPYASEEALARQLRRGLFASQQPEHPRDFRKRHGSCYPGR